MSFHVFLSHSSTDKSAVEELARRLAKEGIQAWLDKWHLIPGEPWQPAIEKALAESETCAVFVGPTGIGPWQNEEMRAAIDQRVRESNRHFRVIPVLLPGAERAERSSVPGFLAATTWVEFRQSLDDKDAFHRLLSGIRGVEPGPGLGQAIFEGQCPYRGLRVFDVEDAPFFFGREALVEWLLNELRPAAAGHKVNRFLAIVGSSGSGKSSVARAGLLAAIKRGDIHGSSGWPVAICRPGPDPIESLAIALSRIANFGQRASALADLIVELQKGGKTLHLTARRILPDNASDMRTVVVVDQFEEVFTICRKDELRDAFISNLLYAAKVAEGQTLVILTMRADFYGKCATNAELAAALSDHNFLVGPMTEDELRRAIELPAQLAGCEFDAGLVEWLLRDVHNQPGALPLLQHALLELWSKREGRRLTAKAYKEIGQLEGALQRRADSILNAFSKDEQELCRRTFLRLTQPGEGTEDTKRRASMQELLSLSGKSAAEEEIVQKLADASLLTTEGDISQKHAFVEVAHEALIRNWPQLRKWIDADRAGLHTRTRLTETTRNWKNSGCDAAYLYNGAPLAVAEEWAGLHSGELSADEAEFLRSSLEAQKQREAKELEAAHRIARAEAARAEEAEKRAIEQKEAASKLQHRAVAAAGAAVAALILLAISVVMWRAAQEQARIATVQRAAAEEQARVATVQRLAAQSSALLEKSPQRSVLLAVEAVRAGESVQGTRVAAAEQSLREDLAFVGGRPLAQSKARIRAVAVSVDNRSLAAGWWDRTIWMWDMTAKDPAANPVVLRGQDKRITALAIGQDNHWLATGSDEGTARLWDLTAKDPAMNPVVLHGHAKRIPALAISQDNHWLVTGSDDGTARLWDLTVKDPGANPFVLRGHESAVFAVAISPDSHWVTTGGSDGTVRLWDLTAKEPTLNPVVLHGQQRGIRAIKISPDNHWLLATGELDSTARLWDLTAADPAGNPVVLSGHEKVIYGVAISSDNHWLATGSDDGTARLWDLTAKDPAANPVVLRDHESAIFSLAISPDNHWLVTGGISGIARRWDLTAKDPRASPVVLLGTESSITALAISPDSRWLVAVGGDDGTLRRWDLTVEDPASNPVVLRGRQNSIAALAISPDNRWLITGDRGNTARLWDFTIKDPTIDPVVLASEEKLTKAVGLEKGITSVAVSQDNHWLVTGSAQSAARLWDLTSNRPAANPVVLRGHDDSITAAAISPDNHWVLTGSWDSTARLWNLKTKDPASNPVVLRGHKMGVNEVAISSDNHWVVTGSQDDTARLWDLTAKEPATNPIVLVGHEKGGKAVGIEKGITSLAISANNHWLVTGSEDHTARLWDLTAKDPAANPVVLRGHEKGVSRVAISPDNRWVVTGSLDQTARLWDLTAKDPAASPVVLRGHEGRITALAISPDSHWLATSGWDTTAWLWDLTAKDPAANPVALRGHEMYVSRVAISPDNRWVVTCSYDGTARLWLLQAGELIDLARVVAGRNLTMDEWERYFRGEAYRKTFANLPGPGDK
jgi:WD40 repeat protein